MNSNPHDAVRPDFNAEAHAPEKQALLDTGLTPEQAIQTLERLWTLQNNRERQEWNRLKEVAALAEAEAAQAVADAEEQRRREEQESNELARREDRKKNKAKYAEIPNLMVPSDGIIFPSPYALKKLKKGDFVELYYFTNRGLEEAEKTGLESDERLVLIPDGDAHSFAPASSTRSSKDSISKDEDLSWEEFLEAAPRMINFMRISEWPESHVNMFVEFWSNLQTHEWRFSSNEFAKRSLLVYQGQQRKRWHLTIGTGRGWSLSQINQDLLLRTRDTLQSQAFNLELSKLSKASLFSFLPVES